MEKYAANPDADFRSRSVAIKEERSHQVKEHLWVLWTDYFKAPHFEKYPNLNTLFNEATKLAGAGGTKGKQDTTKLVSPGALGSVLGKVAGTGFFIDATGHLYTLSSVVGDGLSINVTQGGRSMSARLLAKDPRSGIALLGFDTVFAECGAYRPHSIEEMLDIAYLCATTGRLLILYLFVRQATSALGLTSLGGHPQMVRPLVAPMAEGAAEVQAGGYLPDRIRFRIRGMSAATDNIGLFFGEDIFIAIGSIVLIVGFLEQAGVRVEALHVSLWAIPTAIVALLVHGARLLMFDRQVRKDMTVPDVLEGEAAGQ